MAIDDKFYFHGAKDNRESIGRLIMDNIQSVWEIDIFEDLYGVYNEYIGIDISFVNDGLDQQYFERINEEHDIKDYHFSATHKLFMSWRKKDIQEYAYYRTKIMNIILEHYEGDVIYLAGMECPRLWRRDGQLYLSTRDDDGWFTAWDKPLANFITLPYQMEEMPKVV